MTNIGMKEAYSKEVIKQLNAYLSSVQIAYMNVRGFHWNIVGPQFFALHGKFEEIYNSLNEMADEVAERILTLGGKPLHSFTDYLKVSAIKEKTEVCSADATVKALLEDTTVLLNAEREILALASDNDDEGTASLMSDAIAEQEKLIWMFNALLK